MFLPQGNAWIYSVLDKMAGGEAWFLEAKGTGKGKSYYTGLFSLKETDAYILLNAYDTNITRQDKKVVEFKVPRKKSIRLDFDNITIAVADGNTIVHDLIRADLEEAGLLNPFYRDNPQYRGTIEEMAYQSNPSKRTREGIHFIAERKEKYIHAWHESLTLGPANDRELTISVEEDAYVISIEMTAPEAIVLRIPKK